MSTATSIGIELQNLSAPQPDAPVDINRMPVFWNWELVLTCNFRCTYCNYTALGWDGHYQLNAFPGIERLKEVWTRIHGIYGPVHIEFSGGECSTYPRFFDLMRMLGSMHTITLDTNLSLDIDRLAEVVDLSRIRVSASFHPQFAEFEPFLEKCRRLKDMGVAQIFVNYVAYPDQLAPMADYKRRLKDAGILCFIQPFQGVYKKRAVYPDNYTVEEKRLIENAMTLKGADTQISRIRFDWKGTTLRSGTENQVRKIKEESAARGEGTVLKDEPSRHWSPEPWSKIRTENKEPAPQDASSAPEPAKPESKREPVLCRMGQKYAKTYSNGDTFRCCAQLREDMPAKIFKEKIYLGNLFYDNDLKLLEEPAWCDYSPCPCDRCMVVGQESRWKGRWHAPGAK